MRVAAWCRQRRPEFADSTMTADSRPPKNEARCESEGRYRVLFDMNPVAVYSIDASGVIQEFNRVAAELWGRQPALGDTDERFCGSFKLFRPDGSSMPHEQCPMAQVVKGEILEARDAEVLIERPDGSRIAVIVNIRPLKGSNGEITGAINCFYDITERFRLERERQHQADALADLNRRKDEFLAMLGHELRTPPRADPQRGGDPAAGWGRPARGEAGDRDDAASSRAHGASG